MELGDYNIRFAHMKGKNNVLADGLSSLKTLHIYEEPLENPKAWVVNDTQQVVAEICTTNMHAISINMLHNDQKWEKTYQKISITYDVVIKQF